MASKAAAGPLPFAFKVKMEGAVGTIFTGPTATRSSSMDRGCRHAQLRAGWNLVVDLQGRNEEQPRGAFDARAVFDTHTRSSQGYWQRQRPCEVDRVGQRDAEAGDDLFRGDRELEACGRDSRECAGREHISRASGRVTGWRPDHHRIPIDRD